MIIEEKIKIKPFLRWAGGKRWLTKFIKDLLPDNFNNYHEPFIGGASIFIYLKSNGIIKNQSFISDFNSELIKAYEILQKKPNELIKNIKKLKNTKDEYYKIRDTNPHKDINKATRFIYLNKTSFNGIYRVNRSGKYNVPYGYRNGNNIFDFDNMLKLSELLNDNVVLQSGDFDIVRENILPNDLVFIDPPYTVAHENNGFIEYNQSIFTWEDQERIANLLEHINNIGAYFIMTNAAHKSIDNLFHQFGTRHIVQRHSLIGGNGASREKVNEYIYTNI